MTVATEGLKVNRIYELSSIASNHRAPSHVR